MPWANLDDFLASEAFKRTSVFHGWPKWRLSKLVAAFNALFSRAKRNGASDEKAESLAWPIATEVAKRAASSDTMANLEPTRHYFAAMAPVQAHRPADGTEVTGQEHRFGIVRQSQPLVQSLVAGSFFSWVHDPTLEIGAIHDLILREQAPPEVQAATDPDVPFLFVASYRKDIPAESRGEIRISAEWLRLRDGEVIPLTFSASHDPLNPPELGIKRIDVEVAALLGEQGKADEKTAEPNAKTEAASQAAALAAAAPKDAPAASAKTYEQQPGSIPTGSQMPDDAPKVPEFEAQVAGLRAELDSEKKMRKQAELQAAAYKSEFETSKKVVEELKAAANEQMAELAALTLVQEGKATADRAPYFANLYKTLGREKYEELVAGLPLSTVGAYAVKASASVPLDPAAVKAQRDRMERLLREA